MHSSTLFTLAAAAAAVQGSVLKRDVYELSGDQVPEYLYGICFAAKSINKTAHGYSVEPNLDLPCEAIQYIQDTCQYGKPPTYGPTGEDDEPIGYGETAMTSPKDQQTCICESQWFDQFQGCQNCITKHNLDKLPGNDGNIPPSFTLSAFSSSYCAVASTPTANFVEYLVNATDGDDSSSASSAGSAMPTSLRVSNFDSTATVTFTDPIGNKTDVSLYFTAQVTGAQVTQVSAGVATTASNSRARLFSHSSSVTSTSAQSTSTGSASPLSVNTNSNGQIVATAGSAASSAAAAKASSSSKGAAPTAGAEKMAVAGVLGLAAVVAVL